MKILRISAKCSDMFDAVIVADGTIVGEMNGYVPRWFPNSNVKHYGDYVQLDIDIETGNILNWETPTQSQLSDSFDK